MQTTGLADRIAVHLHYLAVEVGARPPGTAENRRATDYLERVLSQAGLDPISRPFRAKYWIPGAGRLEVDGQTFSVDPDPFSAPCDVRLPVRRLSTAEELLAGVEASGHVLVLDGELSAEKYFPKAFPFFQLPRQQEVIAGLERARPAAVLAVSSGDSVEPRFEDADVAFPSATLPLSLGSRLREGSRVRLRLGGEVREGDAVNVSTLIGGDGPRTVVSAHVDTKAGTPGAFDNGGSVATLLGMAEIGVLDGPALELVFFNGEDHYAAPGEQAWLADTDLTLIRHVVNLDGAGIRGRRSSAAAFAFPEPLKASLRALIDSERGWVEAKPWYESDHAIFAMQGIPSLAITSENVHDLLQTLAHTVDDSFDKVDPLILSDVARFVAAWLTMLLALAGES